LRTGPTVGGDPEGNLKARVDDREVTLNDEGFAFSSRTVTHGGQVGAVGGTGGFSSTSVYQLSDFAGLAIYAADLNNTEVASISTKLAAALKAVSAPTNAILGLGDSIVEGFQAPRNQTLLKLVADGLTAQDTIVENWGLSNQLRLGADHLLHRLDSGHAGAFRITGGARNTAFIWDSHNDLVRGDSVATIIANLTAQVANARSAAGPMW